jgi:predicted transcriptional regulator of viral defense system
MAGKAEIQLYDVAENQGGFITTPQALQAGINRMTLVMMADRGTLERYSRGVYRLTRFPYNRFTQHWAAVLWPLVPGTVLSHETALALFELSDVLPSHMHITLPHGSRVRRFPPSYLVLHHASLTASDVAIEHGLPVTTPVRTIRDCAAREIGPALLRQAILDGARAGTLRRGDADTLWHELLPDTADEELAAIFNA